MQKCLIINLSEIWIVDKLNTNEYAFIWELLGIDEVKLSIRKVTFITEKEYQIKSIRNACSECKNIEILNFGYL